VPKSCLTRVIIGGNRTGAGDLLEPVLGTQSSESEQIFKDLKGHETPHSRMLASLFDGCFSPANGNGFSMMTRSFAGVNILISD
jgi:hypothetical protein